MDAPDLGTAPLQRLRAHRARRSPGRIRKSIYAFVDNYELARPAEPNERDAYGRPITNGRIKGAEIYRSDDAGATWRKTSPTSDFMIDLSNTYGWVFGQVRVDPADANTVYVLGVDLAVSHDGGRSFTVIPQPHDDNHDLWIDPADPRVLYNSNDGGFYQSTDGGRHWTYAASVPTTQFYDVALDAASPFHAYGSIQDAGSRRGTIIVGPGRTLAPVAFEDAPGGEGSEHAIDPADPNIVYSHSFYGHFTRTDIAKDGREGWIEKNIRPSGPTPLRAQWMAPILLSPHDPHTVYEGFQFLFRSRDRGDSWTRISPDLTGNRPDETLPLNASAIPYQTIVAVAESPRRAERLYVGTDDGRLETSANGGRDWTDLTSRLPVRKWISCLVASEHADGTVYVTARGREDDDFAPYAFKSTDNGRTFTSLSAGLPAGPVNVLREDPFNPSVLYVGTDFGVYISTTGGRTWNVLGGNLPSVQVSDLRYQRRDRILVISTYGRGMWGMDGEKTGGSQK